MRSFLTFAVLLSSSVFAQTMTTDVSSIKGLLGCYQLEGSAPMTVRLEVKAVRNAECEATGIGHCDRMVSLSRDVVGPVKKFQKVSLIAQNPAIGMALLTMGSQTFVIDRAAYGEASSIEQVELRQIFSSVAGEMIFSAPMAFTRCE